MLCLGIESTAHTFGASVVNDRGKILSNVKDMYQTSKGGIIPQKAAEHHRTLGNKIIKQALKEAKTTLENIKVIAYSKGPGLPPSLLAGRDITKKIALQYEKPVQEVNHLVAHLEIGKVLTRTKDPVFILATGANTQIIAFEGKKYRIFGETLSIGIGNALDKLGRELGLGFPAGPKMEQLAKKGKYIELPYSVKGMDVEFSGIITKAISLFKKGTKKEDICYSVQETMFAMLTEISERALAHTDKKELLLIGGVAANKRLSEMLSIMCKERKAKFYVVPVAYAGDQAAMIAYTGILQQKSNPLNFNKKGIEALDINPNWRSDQVNISWN